MHRLSRLDVSFDYKHIIWRTFRLSNGFEKFLIMLPSVWFQVSLNLNGLSIFVFVWSRCSVSIISLT